MKTLKEIIKIEKRNIKTQAWLLFVAVLISATAVNCGAGQVTKYEAEQDRVKIRKAPRGFKKLKVALVQFKNTTGKKYILEPAISQMTSILLESGYFEVTEPSFTASVVGNQGDVSPNKLRELKEKFKVDYVLTGTLTDFEVRKDDSDFKVFFGLFGSSDKEEYKVEIGLDYKLLGVPQGNIVSADYVETRRTDTSKSAQVLFTGGGNDATVLKSSGGKLLRYAIARMVNRMTKKLR